MILTDICDETTYSCTYLAYRRETRNASLGELLYRGDMTLKQHFTDHPASVDETYVEHFKVAAHFARCLAVAAGAAAIHAVVPSMCTKTASERICQLHEEMTSGKRGAARSLESVA
jgi:hypothetical protein